MINSRFTVAVHLLALLGLKRQRFPDKPLTSDFAAESVNTNPVVIRRILGSLREAGLVTSQPGPNGGWFLERDPEQITLRDVYRAVEEEPLFSMHHRPPSRTCVIGGNIQQALHSFFHEAEEAMEHKLAQKTVADVMDAVVACAEKHRDVAQKEITIG
jgi:Rrf2 family protein